MKKLTSLTTTDKTTPFQEKCRFSSNMATPSTSWTAPWTTWAFHWSFLFYHKNIFDMMLIFSACSRWTWPSSRQSSGVPLESGQGTRSCTIWWVSFVVDSPKNTPFSGQPAEQPPGQAPAAGYYRWCHRHPHHLCHGAFFWGKTLFLSWPTPFRSRGARGSLTGRWPSSLWSSPSWCSWPSPTSRQALSSLDPLHF